MGGGGSMFFLDFLESLFMRFQLIYDTITLNDHPFLVIFGPRGYFWAAEEVVGLAKIVLVLKH